MQDFNFWRFGCSELTVSISCCPNPPETQLNEIWDQNRKSLVELTKRANTGVRGIIEFSRNRGAARHVGVRFDAREPIYKTNDLGEYYALLLPNVYTMSIMLSCEVVYTTKIEIPFKSRLLVLNVTLGEKIYEQFRTYKLDKYPLFCNKENSPVDCTESESDSDYDEHEDHENAANSDKKFKFSIVVAVLISIKFIH